MLLFNRAAMHLIQVNNLEKYDTAYAGDPFAFPLFKHAIHIQERVPDVIIKLKFILYIDQGNHKPNSQRQGTQEIEDQVKFENRYGIGK